MSETVAEFMEKDVQKYACGEKTRQAKNVLTAAFTASDKRKQKEESAEFARLVDLVMQTDKGRDTLTELSELGYTFTFEKGDFGGFCEPTSKKIAVNPNFGDGYALQTIVHAGQHAIQAAHEPENTPKTEQLNIASFLRRERAMEADACAHEAAFTYQCRDVLPEVYAEAEKNDMPMFRAFVAEMDKSGDEKKAMRASFEAWYDYKYFRDFYDNYHKNIVGQLADCGKDEKDPTFFSKDYPVKDVVDMCVYRGKPYMTAEFLNGDKAYSVPKKDAKEIKGMLADYAKSVAGAKRDTSVDKMATRDKDGKILEPAKMRSNAAVLAKAARGRGAE